MRPSLESSLDPPAAALGLLIVSEVRFLRETLADVLALDPGLRVRGESASLALALEAARMLRPDIVLLDAGFPAGVAAAGSFRMAAPACRVVVIAISETAETVLAWAEAGIAGYVPNTASLRDLASLLGRIARGEQECSSRIAGSLLRRVADARRPGHATADTMPEASPGALTARELEILRLMGAGHSNKDIARQLGISLGTTTSHVHNVLGKMNLHRRAEAAARLHRPAMPG